ncbi:MAG: PSD1 and planctomycete cytochrome C domain-containing protein [Armatimonadetes bacterium]|nr:PSD1 and planctomycete cytochrome C domain-containing protein [Armatimonadota bacterium]
MKSVMIGAAFLASLAPVVLIAAVTPAPKASPPAKEAARPAAGAPSSVDGVKFFESEIKPILDRNCVPCHSGTNPQGKLLLTSRDALLKGGVSGPAVSLEKPETSLFLTAIHHEKGKQMPPGRKLPQPQLDALDRWVKMGLPWTEPKAEKPGEKAEAPPQKAVHWAFRPMRRPAPPAVKKKEWVRSPVDAFLLNPLEAKGLAPNPPAGKIALLRRATYDLTGLPPTPEEVRAFLADASPDAYEKVVDRLLASPQYGEKWGRHWLDLVRYAETNSYERDGTKPNAWKYRDYVIDSFNQDKPYSRFVMEQLAGDELAPRTPESLIATGYYRLGIWDDEPSDPQQALYDDLDDVVNTTSQVFLGLTVSCARCHDHKLDPIPQDDYYKFLAFFAGVQRYGGPGSGRDVRHSLRPLAPQAEQEKYRKEIEAHRAKVKANDEAVEALEKRVMDDLIPVEKEEFRNENARPDILKKRVPRLLSEGDFQRYLALREERKALERQRPKALDMALAVTEAKEPRETRVLMRGNPHVPGEKVEPGFPTALSPPKPVIAPSPYGDTSGRRLALARWIASPGNPLSARVLANRLWQYHFGRGIVRSSNNFGLQGDPPTHPELLDWLASEIVTKGWRLKPIHKMLMLSSAYRMSSKGNPVALQKDPENDLFWRFDMRRLQAEEVRDSILAVNGSLNPERGGPSIYPEIPEEVLAGQSRPGEGWGRSTPEQRRRRSVYIFAKRSLVTPILASFDGPETDSTCPVRFSTTQPTQALGMLNSTFLNEQAKVFAGELIRKAGTDPADRVKLGLWRVLQRAPTEAEIRRGAALIASLQKDEKMSAEAALESFCLVALNLNEFMYLD